MVAWLGARGRGFGLVDGIPKSPVVPAAILFDLSNGGDKGWAGAGGGVSPYPRLAREARPMPTGMMLRGLDRNVWNP